MALFNKKNALKKKHSLSFSEQESANFSLSEEPVHTLGQLCNNNFFSFSNVIFYQISQILKHKMGRKHLVLSFTLGKFLG